MVIEIAVLRSQHWEWSQVGFRRAGNERGPIPRKPLACLVAALLAACAALPEGSIAGAATECRQLVDSPDALAGDRARFETLRMSLRLRADGPWQRVDSPDSEVYVQRGLGLEVGTDSSALRPFSAQDLARGGCALATEDGLLQVMLKVPKRNAATATFLDPHDLELVHLIGVQTDEPGREWSELKSILRSLRFVNRFESIEVCAISTLEGRFEYRNEIGDLREGVVGTTMTRNYGRVTRLDTSAVHLNELVSDGEGGYQSVARVLSRSDCR